MCCCVTLHVLACGLQHVTISGSEDTEDDQAVVNAQAALAAAVHAANKRKEAKIANVRTFVCTE